ncbi:hypothetical protein [Azorhizophilus paspali]|uniref:Uncharacterized protein n=1 Tax=Azorhizophilus paspali TaxID=69963 RepID=A0ABV6SSG8_AZOPA
MTCSMPRPSSSAPPPQQRRPAAQAEAREGDDAEQQAGEEAALAAAAEQPAETEQGEDVGQPVGAEQRGGLASRPAVLHGDGDDEVGKEHRRLHAELQQAVVAQQSELAAQRDQTQRLDGLPARWIDMQHPGRQQGSNQVHRADRQPTAARP